MPSSTGYCTVCGNEDLVPAPYTLNQSMNAATVCGNCGSSFRSDGRILHSPGRGKVRSPYWVREARARGPVMPWRLPRDSSPFSRAGNPQAQAMAHLAELRGENRTFSGTTPQIIYTADQFAPKKQEGMDKGALAGAQYPYDPDQVW